MVEKKSSSKKHARREPDSTSIVDLVSKIYHTTPYLILPENWRPDSAEQLTPKFLGTMATILNMLKDADLTCLVILRQCKERKKKSPGSNNHVTLTDMKKVLKTIKDAKVKEDIVVSKRVRELVEADGSGDEVRIISQQQQRVQNIPY